MSKKFSLIIATIGRFEEFESLLASLSNQNFPKMDYEVIIVDQNKPGFLNSIIEQYTSSLNIKYIHSKNSGASLNRNIGISYASGEIIAFPDDDCTYYPNTLMYVKTYFDKNSDIASLLGQVVDENDHKLIRNWPNEEKPITTSNFLTLYTQITLFTKIKGIYFDENLGKGVKYGAYEDADFIYQLLQQDKHFIYSPKIKVWHPELKVTTMNKETIKNYSMGFGAFCRKNLSISIIYLLLRVLTYHCLRLCLSVVTFNKEEFQKRYLLIIYRIKGFYEYP